MRTVGRFLQVLWHKPSDEEANPCNELDYSVHRRVTSENVSSSVNKSVVIGSTFGQIHLSTCTTHLGQHPPVGPKDVYTVGVAVFLRHNPYPLKRTIQGLSLKYCCRAKSTERVFFSAVVKTPNHALPCK